MNKEILTQKEHYESPSAKIFTISPHKVLCASNDPLDPDQEYTW